MGLTDAAIVMYIYIVERTQIYLTKRESTALAKAARETGLTKSQLIRDAIEAKYLTTQNEELVDALKRTAGLWADRTETGEEYVERIRRGGRLERLYREADQRANDPDRR